MRALPKSIKSIASHCIPATNEQDIALDLFFFFIIEQKYYSFTLFHFLLRFFLLVELFLFSPLLPHAATTVCIYSYTYI